MDWNKRVGYTYAHSCFGGRMTEIDATAAEKSNVLFTHLLHAC